jgi:hypothetical protein
MSPHGPVRANSFGAKLSEACSTAFSANGLITFLSFLSRTFGVNQMGDSGATANLDRAICIHRLLNAWKKRSENRSTLHGTQKAE